MPITETVQIGLEVLAALEALHRRGITHRDLKPSNVFLTPHGAKVLDFGVSLGQTGDVTRLPLTSPGAILGTPKYMAPEQVLGNVATASADLFAMGAILYEMLSGAAAFEADSVHAVLEKVLHGDVPTLAGSPAVAAADRVIHRALAKSPAQRYASAAAMAEDLRTALVADGSEDSRRARPVTRLMVLPFRLLRPDAEIDFLAFSLADAVTNSLSPLESLVVRSTLAAARFASNAPDLRTIASEANVDVVLSGTLLRAGRGRSASARSFSKRPPGPSCGPTPHRWRSETSFSFRTRSRGRSSNRWRCRCRAGSVARLDMTSRRTPRPTSSICARTR